MNRSLTRLMLACVLAFGANALAYAQGSATSSLAGVVVDTAGGVVPGATVTVKNNATASTFETVSNAAGAFSIPVLDPGTYTVTVALEGFKTAVINDVRLLAATPGSIRATLEVGSLSETVEVKGGTELVQTQSATVSSTITTEQITNLPLVSRNALNFVVFLPGVETSAGPRGSTISGLPAEHDQRDLRRREREQQFPIHRRLLLDGHPAAGRGRRSDGHRRDADGGPGRARGGADLVCHAVRHQQLRRQPLPLLPSPRAELELLLQQDPRSRAQRRRRPSVRRPARRADHHPGPLQRPQQGVLLLQHGGVLSADRGVPDANDPAPACAGGMVPLQRHRGRCSAGTRGQPPRRSRSRTTSSRRSTRSRAASSPAFGPPPERPARSPT